MDQIESKIKSGLRLSFSDGVCLLREFELHRLGGLADSIRRELHGRNAYYVVNAHINPTNICKVRCPLCAYAVDGSDSRAFELSVGEILRRAESAVSRGVMQLHLVSSIHPDKSFGWYCDIISAIHSAFPRVHIKAYTAVEIAYFAESSGKTFLEVLGELKSAGLSSLPGGGAEIFDSEVRKQIAPKKIAADTWLKVHQAAHQLGIPTNASMLFGHLETPEQIVDHLLRIRDLQDKSLCKMEEGGGVTSCFDCFVPLVYHGVNTELSRRFMIEPISPQRILRTIAVSRIILRNVNHIKAYWVTLGEQLSQIALSYGADDFDGTVIEEKIHHEAGSNTPKGLTEQHIKNLITTADKIPVNYTNTKNQ